MASRDLSIDTSQGISSVGGLPTPSNSEGPFFTSTHGGAVSTATLSHPTSLAIPSVSYSTSQRAHAPVLLRQHSFSGTDDDAAVASFANMNRRPSLPVSNLHHHPMERQPSYDPRRQPGYLGHHPSIQQSQVHQPLTPLTPTLISPSSTSSADDYFTPREVRHPLWKLECKMCATVLCEQAMQGHLVDDPSQRLFSTNLAIG
ncbi:hypothetical protein BGX20_011022 [Mortierella sp. AD010]|nr:hypothetical protein BGX20_011022 [Mortierella sp. AD010]